MSKIRKKRRTFDEMAAVVADFETSGLTQKAYAQRHQIPIATFSYWLRKVRNQSDSSTANFLAVAWKRPNRFYTLKQPPLSSSRLTAGPCVSRSHLRMLRPSYHYSNSWPHLSHAHVRPSNAHLPRGRRY